MAGKLSDAGEMGKFRFPPRHSASRFDISVRPEST